MSTQATGLAHERAVKATAKQSGKFAIGISGALGATVAILADMYLKDTACALDSIDRKLQSILQIHLHPLGVMALLMVLGVALCFIFPERTTGKAFFRGSSILAMLMTAAPYNALPPIPRTIDEPQPSASIRHLDSFFVPEVFAAETADPNLIRLKVHLVTQDGKTIPEAIYTLADPKTGAAMARSRVAGTDASFYLRRGNYGLSVEVPSYRIAALTVNLQSPQTLTVTLQPSKVPLAFQRMAR